MLVSFFVADDNTKLLASAYNPHTLKTLSLTIGPEDWSAQFSSAPLASLSTDDRATLCDAPQRRYTNASGSR